ncbi:hypothetical protein SDC9_207878 [bioreactor metagenome]|uniref:Uncharacterized protein n=1 Tax=bioreactor metagenome TaxID=1076179 RepID=A0A645JKI9_9ZZZZ
MAVCPSDVTAKTYSDADWCGVGAIYSYRNDADYNGNTAVDGVPKKDALGRLPIGSKPYYAMLKAAKRPSGTVIYAADSYCFVSNTERSAASICGSTAQANCNNSAIYRRHLNRSNLLFIDGHVQNMGQRDMRMTDSKVKATYSAAGALQVLD